MYIMTTQRNWNDGAKEEMEMMGKPDARTANDWNRPATA